MNRTLLAASGLFFNKEIYNPYYCNEIDRVIARAKVRVLKCITVVFECNARTSSMSKRRLHGE